MMTYRELIQTTHGRIKFTSQDDVSRVEICGWRYCLCKKRHFVIAGYDCKQSTNRFYLLRNKSTENQLKEEQVWRLH